MSVADASRRYQRCSVAMFDNEAVPDSTTTRQQVVFASVGPRLQPSPSANANMANPHSRLLPLVHPSPSVRAKRRRVRRTNMALSRPSMPFSNVTDDICSMTDEQLAHELEFIRELGAGNWGCVWLCCPKSPASYSPDSSVSSADLHQVAVKLVFREKKATTAQRVRSLWNEMKIVRSLKRDPHPSIVHFHSFVVTPSYAIIVMEHLPHLIPVEVPEPKAREWFKCLLSAIMFLHTRGIVHNDIKPANILLRENDVPVLVDFGFSEKCDPSSRRAFLSNIAYGTPEYLSPERARGNIHDTRKSDIWSLGITFFEILVGRTPFEYVEGEKFETSEDLEQYWSRTVKGKWIGEWNMSKEVERMLKRMIAPNADIRYTAKEVLKDPYWSDDHHGRASEDNRLHRSPRRNADQGHRRVASDIIDVDHSLHTAVGETPPPVPTKSPKGERQRDVSHKRKKAALQHTPVLPPIEGSPLKPSSVNLAFSPLRSPLSQPNVRKARVDTKEQKATTTGRTERSAIPKPTSKDRKKENVFKDVTSRSINVSSKAQKVVPQQQKTKFSPKKQIKPIAAPIARVQANRPGGSQDRMKAFQRLKALERENISDEEEEPVPPKTATSTRTFDTVESNGSPTSVVFETMAKVVKVSTGEVVDVENTLNRSRSSFKKSLLSLGQVSKRSSKKSSTKLWNFGGQSELSLNKFQHESWEDDSAIRNAKSSLPVVKHAIRTEQVSAENKIDRMSMWIRNVEQVVKEAQEEFASSNVVPLPPLPVRPVARKPSTSRNAHNQRVPRKILAANEIFREDTLDPVPAYAHADRSDVTQDTSPDYTQNIDLAGSPSNTLQHDASLSKHAQLDTDKNNAKRTALRPISPLSQLQQELEKEEAPFSMPNLSTIIDRSVFVSRPGSTPPLHELPSIPTLNASRSFAQEDISTDFQRTETRDYNDSFKERLSQTLTSPARRHVESVYDRFLMATSGVKRVGRGYQSDNTALMQSMPSAKMYKKPARLFNTGRRPMPPPVSSEDVNSTFMDEHGHLSIARANVDEESGSTLHAVRRAIKTIVSGKAAVRR